ncbi:MAG: ExbD/TolR family protein [Planctomycetia bacterium]
MPRRPEQGAEIIELNLTSMLDVVFNILAFFVMTFSPPKPEANFDVNLPPPKKEEAVASAQELPTEIEPEAFNDVTIYLTATPDGKVATVSIEGVVVQNGLRGLSRELERLVGAKNVSAKSAEEKVSVANIVASKNLKYQNLVGAVDALYRLSIKRINFTEK